MKKESRIMKENRIKSAINWKVRVKNPVFWWQIGASVLLPILTYAGLTVQDLTSWAKLGCILQEAIRNPFVIGLVAVSVFNTVTDPTTKGISDSEQALTYDEPK